MGSATGVTVVLVEDDIDDARFVERLLVDRHTTGRGESLVDVDTVERADSLATGIETIAAVEPDVVLLDLGLPDSDGVETVDRLIDRAPGVPVVVLTGQTDLGVDAIRCGAQDYLRKGHITAPLLRRSLRYAIERGRVQRELRDRSLRLAVANELLRTDVRNDVSLVVGLADQLESRVDPTHDETVDTLLDASRHVLRLTDTVADLMDVISGDPASQLEPTDLRAVLEPEIDRFRDREGVELDVEWLVASETAPTVAGTPMLGAMFEHVLSNAATTSERDPIHIDVTIAESDDSVSVEIADDGVGIPDAQKTAIVDPTADATGPSAPGTGLYFVTTVLDTVGGSIEIADNSPRGTVVTITLERADRTVE
ncbi:hybrid sensor histidine kinase/response regulator [Halovivax cerinus]|uniref:histidine kinase n=1 Tax=Halovivax cerinus TaxID=1487865 RepID=A0ABD5NQ01_9EURY|nr:hybrid sensor histidine kinase/response regulator [Halovivax cerinus]